MWYWFVRFDRNGRYIEYVYPKFEYRMQVSLVWRTDIDDSVDKCAASTQSVNSIFAPLSIIYRTCDGVGRPFNQESSIQFCFFCILSDGGMERFSSKLNGAVYAFLRLAAKSTSTSGALSGMRSLHFIITRLARTFRCPTILCPLKSQPQNITRMCALTLSAQFCYSFIFKLLPKSIHTCRL